MPNTTDRERKAYALTGLGRQALEAETARLRILLAKASLRAIGEAS